MAIVLGITGGIGSGKSTVLRMLADLGAQTVSADDVAREVLTRGTPACLEVVRRFGEAILAANGEIDRPALARLIFDDSRARQALDDITHPEIIRRIKDLIDRFRSGTPEGKGVLAVEIPLLIECGMEGMVDEVLLVAAEQDTQVGRLTSRSGITPEQAVSRIEAQMPLAQKVDRADCVIWNDGTLESLENSVRNVWEQILLP
jgi:dephospho-CoA kinase